MIDYEQFRTEDEVIRYLKSTKPTPCRTAAMARQYLREHLPKESYYQDKIIKSIRDLEPSAFVWKAAAGPYSRQGIPDVCAVIRGRYYGFEVKRPFIGVLSRIQERTIEQIKAAGGRAYVVTYPAEVARILKDETFANLAADAESAGHGKWIEDDYGFFHCSECGFEWDESERTEEYCPNCGARNGRVVIMDEGREAK